MAPRAGRHPGSGEGAGSKSLSCRGCADREADDGGARRFGADEAHIPLAGASRVCQRAWVLVRDQLQLGAERVGQRGGHVRRDSAGLRRVGVVGDEEDIGHVDGGAHRAARREDRFCRREHISLLPKPRWRGFRPTVKR